MLTVKLLKIFLKIINFISILKLLTLGGIVCLRPMLSLPRG